MVYHLAQYYRNDNQVVCFYTPTDRHPKMDFLEELLFHSRRIPEQAAIVLAEGRYVSWKQLGAGILAAQASLENRGVTQDDLVSLEVADPIHHLLLACALMRSGICTVNSGLEVSQRAADLGANVFLCGPEGLSPEFREGGQARILSITDDWFLPASAVSGTAGPIAVKEGLPAIIFFTSGTTGIPQPVAKSTRQLHIWICTVKGQMDQTPCSRVLIIPDMLSSFGLTTALASLWSGRTIFIIKTAQACKAIDLYKIEYLVATPYIIHALTETIKRHRLFVQSIRGVRLSGATSADSLLQDISGILTSNIFISYSSTEAASIATVPQPVTHRQAGYAGRIIPGVKIRIVDHNGMDVRKGETGELQIQCEVVSLPFQNKETSVESNGDIWASPGDLAYVDNDGALVISGRTSDVLNIGGAKVSPQAIEEFLEKEPGIYEAAVVSIPPQTGKIEEVHIFVVGKELDAKILKEEWCTALGYVRPQRVHVIPSMPRNRLGKRARGELRALARHS